MRSGYSTVGHRAVGSRDVSEEEAWLGWDLSEEQSSGGGLALGGAVEAKSIMHRVGYCKVSPQLAVFPCLPDKSLRVPSTALGFFISICLERRCHLGWSCWGHLFRVCTLAWDQVPTVFSCMFVRSF